MLISERAAAEQLMQRITVVPMDFQHLRRCGISLTKEPFIRRMLVAVYRNTVINHLTKVGKLKLVLRMPLNVDLLF